MDINLLFYKKSEGQDEAKDYVSWAYHMVENNFSSSNLNMLAFLQEPFNLYEIERIFKSVLNELGLELPTYEEQINAQIQYLFQQILLDEANIISNAYKIYQLYSNYFGFENQNTLIWYEISEMIDDLQYGDNVNSYTADFLTKIILQEVKKQLERYKWNHLK